MFKKLFFGGYMAKLTSKQLQTLSELEKGAQKTLDICKELKSMEKTGSLTGEVFDERINKIKGSYVPPVFRGR